ncbi:MAG: hypothetical protein DRP35_06700 [Candidatus Zixiibacteriota bacterium]|nr:MAG: hypothetical protein DRP35_06700 [candidate division Zixibacteria bacterium]
MLAVGDSTKLEIIFSTKKYKNRVSKRPRIQTNSGLPDKTVQIISHVVARPDSTYPVIIKPYKLNLSQFTEKVRDEINFNITNVSEQDLEIRLIAGLPEYFEVSLPKSIGAGKTAEGTLKLKRNHLKNSFDKSFTFELNDEKTSRFTVPVKRTVRTVTNNKSKTAAIKSKGK